MLHLRGGVVGARARDEPPLVPLLPDQPDHRSPADSPDLPRRLGRAETLYLVLYEEAGESAVSALSLALSMRAVVLALAVVGVPGLVLLLKRGRRGA